MLTPEALQSLDYLIWLGSGEHAAQHSHCSQSAISRRAAHAADVLGVSLRKSRNEWGTEPHSLLLNLERQVHQLYRLLKTKRLRLESDHWAGRQILVDLPSQWISGRRGRIGIQRPMQLLQERVIDAWISCSKPDLPGQDDPIFAVYEIANIPLRMACANNHPLVGESGLTTSDLIQYPSLGLASAYYPQFGALLKQRGLWRETIKLDTYAFHDWEGRASTGLASIPVNALSTDLSYGLSALDWPTGIQDCIALIVLRDLSEQAEIQHLLNHLRNRAMAMARVNEELCVLM
jgi:DNA-binding transcriptional LysR family regulator